MEIQEAYKQFGDYVVFSRTKGTARAYSNGLKTLTVHLGAEGIKLTDPTTLLQPQHFISYPAYLVRNGYAKLSIGTYVAGVKYFYEWLIINALVEPPDYAKSLILQKAMRDAMKRRSSKMVRFPKDGEADLMAEMASALPYDTPIKERNVALVNFLRSSGCRIAEVVALTVGEIDAKERSAVVTGKGDKQRRAYFDNATVDALQTYWKVRGWANPTDPVFARHDRGVGKKHKGITTTAARNIIAEICAAAGIEKGKFTPHYFRHAFAIKMLRETGNLALVQDLLGHRDPASTRGYAKIYPDDLRDAHHEIYN